MSTAGHATSPGGLSSVLHTSKSATYTVRAHECARCGEIRTDPLLFSALRRPALGTNAVGGTAPSGNGAAQAGSARAQRRRRKGCRAVPSALPCPLRLPELANVQFFIPPRPQTATGQPAGRSAKGLSSAHPVQHPPAQAPPHSSPRRRWLPVQTTLARHSAHPPTCTVRQRVRSLVLTCSRQPGDNRLQPASLCHWGQLTAALKASIADCSSSVLTVRLLAAAAQPAHNLRRTHMARCASIAPAVCGPAGTDTLPSNALHAAGVIEDCMERTVPYKKCSRLCR